MVIGFKIISFTDREEATGFVTNRVLMLRSSVTMALDIKDFIFYGRSSLDGVSMDSDYCVAEPVSVFSPVYINISGGKLEVPYDRVEGNLLFRELEPSGYFMAESFDGDVQHIIDLLVKSKYLRLVSDITEFFYLLNDSGGYILQGNGGRIVIT